MKILVDVIEEHIDIKKELEKLPKVGDKIKIIEKDTSGHKGAIKKKIGDYEIKEISMRNKMIVTERIGLNYKECFSIYDLISSNSIHWETLN
ncbi:MAG: hypothetical protein JEZ08_16585 [Clostridiales bacterium]|nr:hypothetical protein [Clostridiales bacterium]